MVSEGRQVHLSLSPPFPLSPFFLPFSFFLCVIFSEDSLQSSSNSIIESIFALLLCLLLITWLIISCANILLQFPLTLISLTTSRLFDLPPQTVPYNGSSDSRSVVLVACHNIKIELMFLLPSSSCCISASFRIVITFGYSSFAFMCL